MISPLNDKIQEPFMPVKVGFGFEGTLLLNDELDKIQCHLCGNWLDTLAQHLRMHNISAREYKEEFELNYGTVLATPNYQESHRYNGEPSWFKDLTPEQIHALAVKYGKMSQNKNKVSRHNRYTIEMMNRFGTCPAQLEERFVKILEDLGHTPTWEELNGIDGGLLAALTKRFKGYSKALNYFGLQPGKGGNFSEYGMAAVKELLKKFVDQYKRLPTANDTKSKLLPDYMTLKRYFGSYMEAKQYAFDYLDKKYPNETIYYNKQLRRIGI